MSFSFPFNAVDGQPAYSAEDFHAFYRTIEPLLTGQASMFPLSIAKGGTGASTAAQARANLDLAAASHNHSLDDVTRGTLPVARGGLGNVTGDGVLVRHNTSFSTVNGSNGLLGVMEGTHGFYPHGVLMADRMAAALHHGTVVATAANRLGFQTSFWLGVNPFPIGVCTCNLNEHVPGRPFDGLAIVARYDVSHGNFSVYEVTRLNPVQRYAGSAGAAGATFRRQF